MTEDRAQPDWPRRQADSGCSGSALPPWGRCLAHLDTDDLEQTIKRAKTEGLDARGVTITPSLLGRIFSLLDRTGRIRPIWPSARFEQATFTGYASFFWATFTGIARFEQATFRDADYKRLYMRHETALLRGCRGLRAGTGEPVERGDTH